MILLGDNIKRIRLDKKMGLNETARKAGITGGYLSSIENNKRTNIGTSILQAIAEALSVTVNDLFGENEDTSQSSNEQEIIKKFEDMPDFEDAEEALKFILEQPVLMHYGGYDLKSMKQEEILETANDMLFALKLSIEKRKSKK